MGRFELEMLLLNILQEHCKRTDDEYWEIERFKNAFLKAGQFYEYLMVLGKYRKKFEEE